ncbi:MAG TPA: LCP family protein [Streptosporangiaceae bacterium]|nr:LCP family protein [Streptosporangiaceae bacterium]
MDGWPDDWFRNDAGPGASGAGSRGSGSAERGASGDPAVHPPHPGAASQAAAARAGGGRARADPGPPPGTDWPDQPPARSLRMRRGGSGGGRRAFKIIATIVALLLVAVIGMYFYLDSRLNRVAVLADYQGRPAASAGQNWLVTGSDSRQGLTRQQENQYATGHDVSGQRSDTIMLLHIGGGTPTLVSLPRDLYVDIPGYGMNKLNAAFSFGGPKLLAQTVQNYTGLRIDHYIGIGFGGLVSVVDSVGGVTICVRQALNDTASGLHLKPGCQTLTGGQALGYVRDRHSFGASDLQRVQDQRAFLKALLSKATSPGVFLNPLAAIPTATSSAAALTVDQGTHLYQLIKVAFALRGPQTTTVPLAGSETTAAGDVLLTDRAKALRLFNALGSDQPVPKDLLSGTSGA